MKIEFLESKSQKWENAILDQKSVNFHVISCEYFMKTYSYDWNVLIPEMIFQRQKMLFRQKIQSYGPDTNDFREFSIICKLNWERVWYFINNVLFNSKIVIFNQRTNRNEQNGTVHNSTWLIELRYRIILSEYNFIPAHWKTDLVSKKGGEMHNRFL